MIVSSPRRWVAGIAGMAAVLACASAAAQDSLRLAYVEFYPYTYTENGEAKGVLLDAFKVAADKAGYTYTTESLPAKRLFQGIVHGDYDVFPGVKTPTIFQGTTLTSQAPIARIELHAWSIGAPPAIRVKEDLAGKKVITLSGYTYGGWRGYIDDAANKVETIEALNPVQALALLKAGRAPLLLQYRLPMQQAMGGETVPGLMSAMLQSTDLFIVVSGKTKNAAEVLSRLEAAYPRSEKRTGDETSPPNS